MLPGSSVTGVPIPVPAPKPPALVAAAPPVPVATPRATPVTIPIPVAVPSPAPVTLSPASPKAHAVHPVVPPPVSVASSAVQQPVSASFAPASVPSVPCLPNTPSAQYVTPSLASLNLSCSTGAYSSPARAPHRIPSTPAAPLQASPAPSVALPASSQLPALPQPQLTMSQLSQAATPVPTVSAAPAALLLPSILVSSAPAPVAPACPALVRKVSFALPEGAKEVVAPSPPAVPMSIPSVPEMLPPTPAQVVAPPTPASPSSEPSHLHPMEEDPPPPSRAVEGVEEALSEEEQMAQQQVPDYSKWLYPTLVEGSSACAPPLKFPLADVTAPRVLSSAAPLSCSEAEVLAALPATLPPEYVIFGGAKYSGAVLDHVRPQLAATTKVKRATHSHDVTECQRLQFLVDQLEVARHYLKIDTRRVAQAQRTASSLATASHAAVPTVDGSDTIQKPEEVDDVDKANIWTAAYFGSPLQLSAVMEKRKFDGMLDSTGYVHYRRRQWGLKRVGDTFLLGLGLRGTLLQFAAVAGKLDSVVLLLACGARDTAAPRLKEILSTESMQTIQAVLKPCSYVPRYSRALTVEAAVSSKAVPPVAGSAFTSEHVVVIDEGDEAPLGRAGGVAAAAMTTFA
ncbi:hypothetical protein LSCM4_00736 [Leishmania orientalis]|uniref:Calphotin-like protein n=1 Tax=Leishmania orientalis TaxID=2249476 RepID=A0A836GUH2_9TRYP|nr:hypothetical protein LSCM4_00736 [Leishmania orientalis]